MVHHRNIYQKELGERRCSVTLIVFQGLNRTLDHVLITLSLGAGIASVDHHTLPVLVLNCHIVFMYTVTLVLSALIFLSGCIVIKVSLRYRFQVLSWGVPPGALPCGIY